MAQEQQTFETSPKEVVVFLSGAELRHETPYQLKAGQTQLKFVGLSASLNLNSISLNFGEKIKIIAVTGEMSKATQRKPSKKTLFWLDSVKYYQKELAKMKIETDALEAEKDVLNANKARIGMNNAVSIADLQNYGNFYKTKMKEIALQLQELTLKSEALKQKSLHSQTQLAEEQQKDATPTYELNVLVSTQEAQKGSLAWSYVVYQAGWSPIYDVRAKGIDKPIQFTYKGNIFNNSGIDWKDVKLTLSTADPTQNAVPPYLTKWTLDFDNANYYNSNFYQSNALQQQQVLMNNADFDRGITENETTVSRSPSEPLSEVVVAELSTTFEIKDKYTIPADNQAYAVEINQYALKAEYNYVCMPKLDRDAYLLARIAGWESLNLIEGDANVYYNDSYIGKTSINLLRAKDTLEVSLGKDKKIMVSRVKKQDYSSKKFMSSTVTETFEYEIVVRNTSALPIQLQLKDQVPVSGNSEIEVEVLNTSKAEKDDNGLLTWKMNLAANETQTVGLSYSIKHPKNKPIMLQRMKNQRQYKK
jgi:uncharacterized protein (TIGR02231 family)